MAYEESRLTPQTHWNAAGATLERINKEFSEFNENHKLWDLIAMKINMDNAYNDVWPKIKEDTEGKKLQENLDEKNEEVGKAFKTGKDNDRWKALMELNKYIKRVMDHYGMYLPDKEIDDPTMAAYD